MSDAMSLKGKRVVVVGGASGIGFAVAALAGELGASVVIGSSNATRVDVAAGRLAGASGGTIDLRDEASIERFFAATGRFDHLVITAGDWTDKMFASVRDLNLAEAQDGLAVRFWGSVAAVKQASRTIAPEGSITLTSGMLAHRPQKGAPIAAALGGAMELLARGLAADLAPVRVNAVCPGIVLTEHVTASMPAERLAAYVSPLPLPRGAQPAEAAMAYVYLMLNTYVTGQIVPVDGGGLLV